MYLNSDYSLNCDEQRHVHFENLARFFIIYVFNHGDAAPKRRQKAKRNNFGCRISVSSFLVF